jgi:DNA-binding NarL/FixJ family response regulator
MRFLVVDDHILFREGLKFMLRNLERDIVVEEASTCEQAIKMAAGPAAYDLVLLDLNLPGHGGLDALAAFKSALPHAPLVILSGEDDPALVRKAIDQGAMGFIPKTSTPKVMIEAVQLILNRGTYLPPHCLERPHPKVSERHAGYGPVKTSPADLSPRQSEVLRLLMRGCPNKVIARQLGISESTVKTHVVQVMRTLGASNRTQAVYAAARSGMRFA